MDLLSIPEGVFNFSVHLHSAAEQSDTKPQWHYLQMPYLFPFSKELSDFTAS
jgi:hypothetical protein